jgi:hypothetical protein
MDDEFNWSWENFFGGNRARSEAFVAKWNASAPEQEFSERAGVADSRLRLYPIA